MKIEEKIKNLEKILVAIWENEEFRLYEPELFEKWKGSKTLVEGPERESETETDAGHFVLRIYHNKHGYWLYKTWVSHLGYSWEEDQLYFLPEFFK